MERDSAELQSPCGWYGHVRELSSFPWWVHFNRPRTGYSVRRSHAGADADPPSGPPNHFEWCSFGGN